ncbi:esterase-like activity of phytase family protein [Rhodanobacter sp. L36]|uniref:esterase-like activity of phytase family protein n=1 Tax=Rhodanobacter sp. L36 TaxID=1747221 RepID=UPI00131DBAEA|nr:esterase-like activity of phytase family protein [Rhodanobacter sp. L36]
MKSLLLALLVSGQAFATTSVTTPHLEHGDESRTVTVRGQQFVNEGLVGTGRLSAQTVDFLGDTLGSFSSLAIDKKRWRKVGDHYEGTLWTLPDRGRNDPAANLFYDYAARLHRFHIRFKPYVGKALAADVHSQAQVSIVPDGGIELRDFHGRPFTGADPGTGTITEHGVLLPSPHQGIGAGKISIDAESLQFTRDGSFYVGDEYAANVYFFDPRGHLRGVLVPPPAVTPRTHGKIDFNSLAAPDSGRRNNQGVEGMSLSPDGTRLFVALQSALIQDSARHPEDKDDASGRVVTRVMVYDVTRQPVPARPIAHYVIELPAYRDQGDGKPANKTAAESEIRALNDHQLLILARDGNGLGTDNDKPIVYKSMLLVDTDGATNLAGTTYENTTASVLESPGKSILKHDIHPMSWVELVNMLNPDQLARFGMNLTTQPRNQPLTISEKWEAMDFAPAFDAANPDDFFLFVGNDNDFIARHCVMEKQSCDSNFDNDNMLLVYRLTLPGMTQTTH